MQRIILGLDMLEYRIVPDSTSPIAMFAPPGNGGGQNEQSLEFKQVDGPKDGVANLPVSNSSGTRVYKSPAGASGVSWLYPEVTFKVTVSHKKGYKAVPGTPEGAILRAGEFKIDKQLTMGAGFEKSKSEGVDIGVAKGLNAGLDLVPNLITFGGTIERSVIVTTQKTDTNFVYYEGGVTIGESSPLLKDKDVKVAWLVPFVELNYSYELLKLCNENVESSQRQKYGEGYVFTPRDITLMRIQREYRAKQIVSQLKDDALPIGKHSYWQHGNPLSAIYTRDHVEDPETQDPPEGGGGGGGGGNPGGGGGGNPGGGGSGGSEGGSGGGSEGGSGGGGSAGGGGGNPGGPGGGGGIGGPGGSTGSGGGSSSGGDDPTGDDPYDDDTEIRDPVAVDNPDDEYTEGEEDDNTDDTEDDDLLQDAIDWLEAWLNSMSDENAVYVG